MGETVVLGWLVLELTGSPFMVGFALGLRSLPALIFGLFFGAVADRVDRRALMKVLSVCIIAVAGLITLLIGTGVLELWHLFVLTFVSGGFWAAFNTTRQSFAFDVVGPSNVMSGLAYVSLGMRIGGALGSLATGFLIDRSGFAIAYLMITIGYLISTFPLLLIESKGQSAPSTRQSVLQNLKEFGNELRINHRLLVLVILVAAIEILGFSHLAALPSLARDVLKIGADGFGILSAVSSVGGLVALAATVFFGELRKKGILLLIVVCVFGVGILILGFSTSLVVALIAIVIISGMMALSDLISQGIMQTVVSNELRGRAMGAWVVAAGTAPLGTLQVGALASALGVGVALMLNGVGLIVLGLLTFATVSSLRRL